MLIRVKAFPSSKKNRILAKEENSLQVYTKSKAEQGKANSAIKEMLAAHFDVSLKQVKLLRGFKQQNKLFNIQKG